VLWVNKPDSSVCKSGLKENSSFLMVCALATMVCIWANLDCIQATLGCKLDSLE